MRFRYQGENKGGHWILVLATIYRGSLQVELVPTRRIMVAGFEDSSTLIAGTAPFYHEAYTGSGNTPSNNTEGYATIVGGT